VDKRRRKTDKFTLRNGAGKIREIFFPVVSIPANPVRREGRGQVRPVDADREPGPYSATRKEMHHAIHGNCEGQ
jgi:hypothetical protein